MFELFRFKQPISLKDYTLIIPSVSVGNVPQLTADLIISTYNLKKAATIWHPGIIPSVGGDPFENNIEEICTACELFIKEDIKLGVIQLRSGLDNKYALQFLRDLKDECLQMEVSNVILLASSFAYEMHDVKSSKYRYATNYMDQQLIENLGVVKLDSVDDNFTLHGTGFAEKLYGLMKDNFNINLLLNFVSEGDNRPDAVMMLNILQGLLPNFKDQTQEIHYPASWSHVFGNPPPIGIY